MYIKVLDNFEEIETIRHTWQNMQVMPSADIDFFRTIVESRPEVLHPRVLVIESQGKILTILVGRVENTTQNLRIGYTVVLRQSARVFKIMEGGLMGEASPGHCSMLIDELMSSLGKGEIDVVELSNLNVDTELYNLAISRPPFLSRDHFLTTTPHWSMDVPATSDDFYKRVKGKHRYWLQRLLRVLNKEFGTRVTITKLEGAENVKKICSDLEEVVKKTYHRKIGVGFVYNQEFLGRFALEAQKGWLRAYILYIDDIPEAFWLGYLCHGTFYLAFTGYNPAYRKYELGTIVFINLLEDLGRMGVSKVDFGSGTALYKERFGQHMWHEATVYIFAPTLRGIILNVSKSFFSFINNAAKKILDKTNLLQNVKTQWRTSLQKRQKGYLLNK